jgi:hypothetical protein
LQEVFIAIFLMAVVVSAYPANENQPEPAEALQIEDNVNENEPQADLEGSESRFYGGYGRGNNYKNSYAKQ